MLFFSQCQWNANAINPFSSKPLSTSTHQPLTSVVWLIQSLLMENAHAILVPKPILPTKYFQSLLWLFAMKYVHLTPLLTLWAYAPVRLVHYRPMGFSLRKWIPPR